MVQNIGLSNNNEDTKNENKKTIIPLPAPSTYSNGNAYGGNQSFVHSSNDLIRNSSSIGNDSSSYWSDSDGVTAGSSNSSSYRKPGVVGLSNIGNTCFMNSGLQCLLSTPSISEFFLKAKLPTIGAYPKNLSLLQNFQYIVKQAWCGPQPKLVLHDFKNCLAVIHTQFKDSRQHDCQEFLALLLDSLHEQLKKWTEIQETSDGNGDNGVIGDSMNEDICGSSTSETITSSSATASTSYINSVDQRSSENCNDENELTSTSTQTVTKVSEVRTSLLHHSSLKDHNVRRSNFEAKSKHQIKSVKGAQISFFTLPNFTPAGSLSNKSVSSTPPKSIKENQWMAIKSPCTPLKSLFPRRRKKKNEDLDSPRCSKKKKLDTSGQEPEESFSANYNGTKLDPDLTKLATETDPSSKTTINGVVKMSQHSCNGDISDITTSTVLEKTEGFEKIKEEMEKPHRPTKEEEAKRAAVFWEEHINANNTVIAKTLQGLFKSTVICSTCDYVSVTYEPFMYLSLPFPRILERNLGIWFISMKNRRPKRIDLTVGIMDSVMQVKQKLTQSILEDLSEGIVNPENLVMAEVCNNSVCRVIENNIIVRKLNHNRNMYMYELNDNFDERYESLWTPTSEFNSCVVDNSTNGNSQFFGPWNYNETSHVDSSTKTSDDNHVVQSNIAAEEEDWDAEISQTKTTHEQIQCRGSMNNNSDTSEKQNTTRSMQSPESDVVSSSVTDELPDNSGGSRTLDQSNTMQCIICLEDCPVTDMRQHIGCDCIICGSCLENSIKHHPSPTVGSGEDDGTVVSDCGNNELKCATCMNIVDGKEFIPYRTFGENGSPKLSMELVSIIFRNDPNPDANNNSSPIPKVFGYPWLIKIPSILPAQEFHDYIASINPFPLVESNVLIVSLDGKTCGQCSYGSSCHGCKFSRRGNVAIRPRTSIAISYIDLNDELQKSIDPKDMTKEDNPFASSWLRSNEPNYDIHDCLRAFSEIENLDEQNPWFCPHCAKNQCATKSLTVCHFPDYLIVYLKRFVFMDHSSNKLNNKLKFPVDDLDLNEYIAEEFSGKDWMYDLYACICHFGSISSGHYTAYGKNPVTKVWHYFNDEIVSEQRPQDVEHSSGYVLFYARKGVQYDIPYKQLEKVRPLPELVEYSNCSSRSSRPTHAVQPNSSITAEDEYPENQVSSSSASFSQSSSPVNCFTGESMMDEMLLSVGADSKNTYEKYLGKFA